MFQVTTLLGEKNPLEEDEEVPKKKKKKKKKKGEKDGELLEKALKTKKLVKTH